MNSGKFPFFEIGESTGFGSLLDLNINNLFKLKNIIGPRAFNGLLNNRTTLNFNF